MTIDHVTKLLNVALDVAEQANKAPGGTIFHADIARTFVANSQRAEFSVMAKTIKSRDANLLAVVTVKRLKPQPFEFTVELKIMGIGEGDLRREPYEIVGLRITKPEFITGERAAQKWASEVLAEMRKAR